ncbi:MAG TPA: PD-(D/E)XK nuclease family protein, partial [Solirubrobacteraceae bacterium]|nr:PD-(D/E)XK nuclease family protein [Solirubrobacteraceae bacterium]
LGPANSAKAGEVLGAYAAAARRGALLVVPTAADALHYARELAGDGAVLGSVLTFSGLAAEIARRADYGGRRLSELQRARLLERVVARSDLEVLGPSAAGPGFAAAAGELIAELQRGLVAPERFTAALRRWAAQDVRRAPYAREVGRIYSGYVRELDRVGRVDRELFAWRALDALRAAPWRWAQTSRDAVYFYGFDDLTPLERDAVETLARVPSVEVTVSLTYEPGREALSARAETVEELRPLADRVIDLPAQDEHYAAGSREALHHLERHLFAADGAPRQVDPGDAVVLLEAGGERAEAELVAERVLALVRDGVPTGEIVVVHRSPASAAPLFARVFAQYGVALHTGLAPSLDHTPLGRGLFAAGRCALLGEEAASADDLLTYLRTPGVLERPELADALEADIRRGGLRTAAQARERLGWELPELDALAGARDPARELCRLARRLFGAPHRATAAVLTAEEELDAAALRTLMSAVDELAELALTPPPAELLGLLGAVTVDPPGFHAAGSAEPVRLAEPLEVRARRFRAVFICGLQEGEFPRPASPEPFFSDDRRRELALASGLALRAREDSLAAERYLFYASVSRATERVFLAFRSSDEEGNLALPSPFIADVAELLTPDWRARRATRLLADVVWPPDRAPTERERRRALAARQAAVAGEEPAPQRTLSPAALARVRHSQVLSPGALESYGDCPVKWLIERELQPQPLAPDPDAVTRGNVMHDVLERLLRELAAPLTPATLGRARHTLERLLVELGEGGADALVPGGPDIVRAGALRAIEADLRRYLEHEASTGAGWRPLGLELRFGFAAEDEESLPGLKLGDAEDRVLIRGVIDRVDVDDRGRAMVRDYKSGTRRPEWAGGRWSTDRRLQVALYMLVVRELLDRDPIAGFYQPLRGDDLRARGVFAKGEEVGAGAVATDAREPAEIEEMLADAAARAVTLAAALRRGELTPCPQTCSRDGCAHPAICRSQ